MPKLSSKFEILSLRVVGYQRKAMKSFLASYKRERGVTSKWRHHDGTISFVSAVHIKVWGKGFKVDELTFDKENTSWFRRNRT
jgi:hypothetical protein